MTNHPKIAAIGLIDSYWAIDLAKAERIQEQIEALPIELCLAREAEFFAAVKQQVSAEGKPYEVKDGIAYFSLEGLMTKDPTSMGWFFGGTSTTLLRRSIRTAMADPEVKQGFMETNSGGGALIGTEELAADIAAFAKVKPFTVFVTGDCGSAAMWAVSGATKIYALKTANIGSIGIRTAPLVDSSRKLANEGVTVHSMAIGEHKAPGERGVPVTQAQIDNAREHLGNLLAHFVAGVAEGRGLTEDQAAALATGQVWSGDKAHKVGLIDGICSMDECLQTISQGTAGTRQLAAKAAHNPGTAAAASPLEKPMTAIQRVVAYFSGNPEARALANLSEAELAQVQGSAPVDPAITQALAADKAKFEDLEARLAGSEAIALNTLAEAFADNVIKVEKKADPVSRQNIIGMFKMAAIQDGGGTKAKFENGVLVEGANMKFIRDDYATRGKVEGHGVVIPDRKPGQEGAARPVINRQTYIDMYNRRESA